MERPRFPPTHGDGRSDEMIGCLEKDGQSPSSSVAPMEEGG